jgi:hypothetical protein
MGCCYTCNLYNTDSRAQHQLYGNNSQWMKDYLPFLKDKKVIELTFVGSHDSGTYRAHGILQDLAICQNISIKSQLELGIRYLDLRYAARGKRPKDVWVYHGPTPSIKFENALLEIAYFLKNSPEEFITVKMQQEGKTNVDQKNFIISLLHKLFSGRMVTSKDKWWNLETVTLGQVLQNKKNLWICADAN